jgi:hypothetical protein
MKQVNVCTQGECNGECYRCRLHATTLERDEWERIARLLFDRCIAQGTWGPWSEDWSKEYEEKLWTR